jgi:hypothetical protein
MWTWLASQVQHRARSTSPIVAVPAMPASGVHPATPAFIEWTDLNDEYGYSGATLAWAWVRALAALLEADDAR